MGSGEIMSHPLISIRESADVVEAARLMSDCSMGAIGVLGPDKGFRGIFTERDLMWVAAQGKNLAEVTLNEVVNDFPVVVQGPIDEADAIERMRSAHVRHLIVEEAGDYRIVSMRDLFSHLRAEPELRARDVMSAPPVACRPDAYFEEVAEILADRDISGLAVVDDDDELVGVISERDLAHALGGPLVRLAVRRNGHPPLPEDLKNVPRPGRMAKDIMTAPPITVSLETRLTDIAGLMATHKINRLPVMQADKLVGMVSRGDVLGAIAHLQHAPVDLEKPLEVLGGGHQTGSPLDPFAGLVS